jgi:hypothetical protein
VTDGVGFVGKGDVQTALGYANDAAIQQAVKDGKTKFIGGGYRLTTDKGTSWACSDGSTQHHHYRTTTIAQARSKRWLGSMVRASSPTVGTCTGPPPALPPPAVKVTASPGSRRTPARRGLRSPGCR